MTKEYPVGNVYIYWSIFPVEIWERIYGSWTSVCIWESDHDNLIQQKVLSQQEKPALF